MTQVQQIHFAAQIQIGVKIKGYGGMIVVVTEITDKRVIGYSKDRFDKTGKKDKMSLEYTTIMNGHYNKGLQIIK